MGRIAAAMKRAQRQREGRAAPKKRGTAKAAEPQTDSAGGGGEAPAAASPLGTEWIAEPPVLEPIDTARAPIEPDRIDQHVVACHEPAGLMAEKYRAVRTRLLTARGGRRSCIYAVASTLRGEGRSVTAANLGFCLAELRHVRAAVVDLDWRTRGLTGMFGLTGAPGIADVVREDASLAEVCVPAVHGNFYVVPAGDLQNDPPSVLLGAERLGCVFSQLLERFHYVFVDTPPMHDVADVGLIAPLCHSVLLVVRMNRTPEPLVRRSVKVLQANRVPIEGCILTGGREEHIPILSSEEGGNAFGSGF